MATSQTSLSKDYKPFQQVRRSLALHMIRHAESGNNEVYRNAKLLYRRGADCFDEVRCSKYISTHRRADPELSTKGYQQADTLAEFLTPHLENQASYPVRILCSPMKRTLLTIKPTLERLQQRKQQEPLSVIDSSMTICKNDIESSNHSTVHITVVAFYHETEGCHLRGTPEAGMNPSEIRQLLRDCVEDLMRDIEFVGFPNLESGWYANGMGPETRSDAELRAAKYCLWLTEYLDQQLQQQDRDLFDAGVLVDGEEYENEHDRHAQRIRRRRTVMAIGHGDFMSSVLKRIACGFGHFVETEGIPHRSAFAHFNTGITELEYFGHGRYLIMNSNSTPHIPPSRYRELRSGGTLRDGWSFLVPPVLEPEVEVAFSDDELQDHIREQTTALKALYLSSSDISGRPTNWAESTMLQVNEEVEPKNQLHFIVKRGLQVLGVATYSEETGQLKDVAIRPTAVTSRVTGTASSDVNVAETLIHAVKQHARKMGRSNSLVVHVTSEANTALFKSLGFSELVGSKGNDDKNDHGVEDENRQYQPMQAFL